MKRRVGKALLGMLLVVGDNEPGLLQLLSILVEYLHGVHFQFLILTFFSFLAENYDFLNVFSDAILQK